MPTASDVTEVILWAALPNGFTEDGDLALSVFVSPQLNATMSDHSNPLLSVFPDFVDWPTTIGTEGTAIAFRVTFGTTTGSLKPVDATYSASLDSAGWQAVFSPTGTDVTPYEYTDMSGLPIKTFSAQKIAGYARTLYGKIGAASPTAPVTLQSSRKFSTGFNAGDLQSEYQTLLNLAAPANAQSSLQAAFADLRAFHTAPEPDPDFAPSLPTVDFHQAIAALGSYPAVLRRFGLVFDLTVPVPASTEGQDFTTIQVTPVWTSHFTGGPSGTKTDVSPLTNIVLEPSATVFRSLARSSTLTYSNGMLDLTDPRFFVTDLDVDLAGDRINALSLALQSITAFHNEHSGLDQVDGSTCALTVPALRSNGPGVIWEGWGGANGLQDLLTNQTSLSTVLASYLQNPSNPLPSLYTEDITRGHRFDVYTASDTSVSGPSWLSLHGRAGSYTLGGSTGSPITFTVVDEGYAVPGATQAAGTKDPPPPDLMIHESFMRWSGWGLSVQHPGDPLGYTSIQAPPTDNPSPAPAPGEVAIPQLSATFQAINIVETESPNPYPFPKLRYGNQYQFRARAADMAGNGIPLSSTDGSTATPVFTHYRYEPVAPPTIAGTAPFSVAESTLLVVLLNDLVNPVVPNGRWLFPPRAAQRLCEEHGMFDGFVLGSPPNPALAPDGSNATWTAISNAEPQRIVNVTGVEYDPGKGKGDTPYFDPSLVLTTPWLPDPLSSGAGLVGLPGPGSTTVDAVAPWSGSPWPTADPVLLLVSNGTTESTSYVAATGSSSAMQLVTLPPAGVSVVWVSSALTEAAFSTLGVYNWITSYFSGDTDTLDTQVLNGQVWQLSPFRVLRIVHAVRLPLIAPRLRQPTTDREVGSNSVDVSDTNFLVDEKSTSALDFHAVWTDPYDNPLDPESDPSKFSEAYKTSSGPAFRLAVADPTPIGPESQPLTVVAPTAPFAFGPNNDFGPDEGSTHHIGDTKHHLVYYTVTGTSRYAEMFETSFTGEFKGETPVKISKLGINPTTVVVTRAGSSHVLPASDYVVHPEDGTLSYKQPASSKTDLTINFQPTTTLAGQAVPVEVLASARPVAPHVSRIIPAWEWAGPAGSVETGIVYDRTGGYLRVYLERPWWSTGAGELLGVVTPTVELPLATLLRPAVPAHHDDGSRPDHLQQHEVAPVAPGPDGLRESRRGPGRAGETALPEPSTGDPRRRRLRAVLHLAVRGSLRPGEQQLVRGRPPAAGPDRRGDHPAATGVLRAPRARALPAVLGRQPGGLARDDGDDRPACAEPVRDRPPQPPRPEPGERAHQRLRPGL